MLLTKREKEILVMLGLPNKEIAKRKFVGICTVKTHVHNILIKLDVTCRSHAISTALKAGIINIEQIVTE